MADPKQPKRDEPEAAEPEATEPERAEPEAAAEPEATQPEADEPEADEPEADEPEEPDADESESEEPAQPKRRGSAETSAGRKQPARRAPTADDGAVEVRAKARFVRTAPRKARLVVDHIRGKSVDDARAILRHTPRAAATDVAKLLESAVANAENNFELDPDELRIQRATVDEGPTIKRYQPRALGRATPINKRTSHIAITLTTAGAAPGADAGASADADANAEEAS